MLSKADWVVLEIPEHAEGERLVREFHYAHSAAKLSVYRHGLYRTEWWPFRGDVMGVAFWMPPTPRAALTVCNDHRKVLALSRLVVHPDVPTNGASFLLGRSMKMIDRKRWPVLLTYADTALGHTGAIYKATNWECLGEMPPSPRWVNARGEQQGAKRGPRNLTRQEMADLGFTLQPAMPKIKFVHRVTRFS